MGLQAGKGGKRALNCLKMDKISRAQEKEINKNAMAKLSKGFLDLPNFFKTFMVQHDEALNISGQIIVSLGMVGTPQMGVPQRS